MRKVYMYIESIDRLVWVSDTETREEAIHHCELYFNRNPHDYLIWDGPTERWLIYSPLANEHGFVLA